MAVMKKAKVAKIRPVARNCGFCEKKTNPTYTDSVSLKKFMSDRARVLAASRTGVCSKHQRRIAREIKYARHLAILPFVASI